MSDLSNSDWAIDRDWNERAAKALGLSEDCQRPNYFYMGTNDDSLPQWGWCHVDKMKFTKSFDWAMLGEKALDKDYEFLVQRGQVLVGKLDEDGEFDVVCDIKTKDNSFPTPEQITRAWVTVLEENNGNRR